MISEDDLAAPEADPAYTNFRDVQTLTAEVRRLQRQLDIEERVIDQVTTLNTQYRQALETIHRDYGKVCAAYETCTHQSCESSAGAWFEADKVFRATEETHEHPTDQHRDGSEPGGTADRAAD